MKSGGKSTSKHGKSMKRNAVRRSVRITRDPFLESSTVEQEAVENDTRENATGVNETCEKETRVNETREIETSINATSEQQKRVNETYEQETRANDQPEDEIIVNENGDNYSDNDDQENPDEPVRKRGPNHGADIPENRDDRPTIIAIGGRFPNSRVVSDITVMLRSHFDGPWPTWSKVPENMKENLWAKFTKHYKWSSWRHHQIRKAWETTNANRFRDILCEERKRAEVLASSNIPADWKNRNPNWIPRRYWNMLIDDVWSTEKWQKKSTSGKHNRIKGNEKAEPTYTGGSIPIEAHKMRMRKELNRDPTEIELYDRTHKKNRGTGDYVCPKAKRVRETYEKNIEEKYPNPETRPSFDPSMWREASGGLSKQRLYGFGPSRRGIGVLGSACSGLSSMGEGSLEGEEYDKKIIDVEKMVEDIKLKTESSIKEAKDEIMKFKKELPSILRAMLQEIKWTNTAYAGGSGRHQQDYLCGGEYSDEFSESGDSEEYSYDRVAKMPRKHRVYGHKFDDDAYDDDVYDVAGYKKSKDNDGKMRRLNNGKNAHQGRTQKK